MTELSGKLSFIRDCECTTNDEKMAINEAIAFIEHWSAISKTFEDMISNYVVDTKGTKK